KWLSKEGVAAFVLKYRLVKTETADPVKELSLKMTDRRKFDADNAQLIPLAVRDGLEAIKFLRRRSGRFNINPERIGIMGFSAGGTIAVGTTLEGQGDSRPDFVASIYAYLPPHMQAK